MTINIDRRELVPEGKGYQARAIEVALDSYAEGTKTMVKALFEIQGGKQHGRFVEWAGFFTEKTKERTLESLVYMGLEHDDLTDLSGLDRLVNVTVEHQKIEKGKRAGEWKDRVGWVNKPGGLFVSGMDDDAKRAFAAELRGDLAAVRAGVGDLGDDAPKETGASSPSSSSGDAQAEGEFSDRNPPPIDDDVPF